MTERADALLEDFELLDTWEDRYRYVIELGKDLAPLPPCDHTAKNKVKGCVSQVWLRTDVEDRGDRDPVLRFAGDSDAHIVRGLIAILFALYSGKRASAILDTDAAEFFARLDFRDHLSPQRSNGLFAMIERIRNEARNALQDGPGALGA